jgi:flap endonuclease-1
LVTEVKPSDIHKALSLTPSAFIDFALLMGTDFTTRIKNIGPVRALKLIGTHGSIEEILKSEVFKSDSRITLPPDVDEFLEQVASARTIFTSLPPVPGEISLQQGETNEETVFEVLKKFGLQKEMVAEDEGFFTVGLKGNYFGDNPHYT